jgi:hypothetical protein
MLSVNQLRSSSLEIWRRAKTLHHNKKNQFVTKCYTGPRIADSCEHGNEPSGSIKDGECLD